MGRLKQATMFSELSLLREDTIWRTPNLVLNGCSGASKLLCKRFDKEYPKNLLDYAFVINREVVIFKQNIVTFNTR